MILARLSNNGKPFSARRLTPRNDLIIRALNLTFRLIQIFLFSLQGYCSTRSSLGENYETKELFVEAQSLSDYDTAMRAIA